MSKNKDDLAPADWIILPSALAPPSCEITPSTIDNCPSQSGSYIIWVELSRPIQIKRPAPARLDAGLYAYCGSAKGPGGLKARIKRHLSPNKRIRWHIDQVTSQACQIGAWGWLDIVEISECQLVHALLATDNSEIPIKGFGSSDCKTCPSHFLKLSNDTD